MYGMVSIQNMGGWQNWQTVLHTIYLNAGLIGFGIFAKGGGWNINWFCITILTEDVFAYGDLLTFGHDKQTHTFSPPCPNSYAKYLNQKLTNLLQPAAIIQHLGLPGWKSSQMLDKINNQTDGLCPIICRNPTLLLVMILVGTNNLWGIEYANVPEDCARSIVWYS